MRTLEQLGEFGLIDYVKRHVKISGAVKVGIGDDAAVLDYLPGKKQLLTTDMLVEGRHFTRKIKPGAIGYKALAVSISDIASMGGEPQYALISLGVPSRVTVNWIQKFFGGLNALAREYHIQIIGGDTVKSEKIVVNVTLTGVVKTKEVVLRRGAKEGDQLFVTGPLGNSLKSGWHCSFVPRVRASRYLVQKFKPTSMIDISDGLSADLGHILKAGKVGARLFAEKIPARAGATLAQALNDGEDFELLFTLSTLNAKKLHKDVNDEFSFFHIGEIVKGKPDCLLIDSGKKNKKISLKGFTHF